MFKRRKRKAAKKENKCGKIKHKKTEVDGIIFDSEMESKYYLYLKELQEQGIVKCFRLQTEFILQDKYIIVDGQAIEGSNPTFNSLKRKNKTETVRAIKYRCDFDVDYMDGHNEIVDTKGKATVDFEIKRKLFMYKYPDKEFKVIIYDKKKDEWVDYYLYQKEKRQEKKNKKLLEESK
jgi:hypothetical protein